MQHTCKRPSLAVISRSNLSQRRGAKPPQRLGLIPGACHNQQTTRGRQQGRGNCKQADSCTLTSLRIFGGLFGVSKSLPVRRLGSMNSGCTVVGSCASSAASQMGIVAIGPACHQHPALCSALLTSSSNLWTVRCWGATYPGRSVGNGEHATRVRP